MNRVELQRLIDIIVEELIAAGVMPEGSHESAEASHRTASVGLYRPDASSARCHCHAVVEACCPDRLRPVLDAGATRVGVHAVGGAPSSVAAMIDHTLLRPDASRKDIEDLCAEAAQFRFATVCVNPTWVALAAQRLAGTTVGVCSVVGFPLGATTADVKGYETHRAIFDGAREIDMVINIGALKSGELRRVERDIEAVTGPCRDCGALSKVIIEAALLTDEEKVTACTIAKAAGADYVKTSTGFGPGGATVADVALMRRIVGPEMGVKAAGGVRDLEGLKAMIAAGASRVGASAGVKIVQQAHGAPAGSASDSPRY
jgi:deoxyribose-phosphate aldolase